MSTGIPSPVSAKELHELLLGPDELALLDVREPGSTASEGAVLLAVSLPLSRIELDIDRFVPRRGTPVVVLDSSTEGLAERAARRLGALGYTDVRFLEGGVGEWGRSGYKVHAGGVQLLGQAFGEFVEHRYGTPHITVGEMQARIDAGDDIVLLDSRPLAEFEVHSLPGGTSIPGAELVYRSGAVVPSPDTLVVVHCAGRTRSILGAQVLINAGLPNQVVALEGGTQAWVLEGREVEHGMSQAAPAPSPEGIEAAKQGARRIAERFDVPTIGAEDLRRFRAEDHVRSLYLLDVRGPEEFVQGHLPGSRSAPSWDLAPWIFRHVATRNARIVLLDDPDLVRATAAASWVIQMGWGEVSVASYTATGEVETGPDRRTAIGVPDGGIDLIAPDRLRLTQEAGADVLIVDLELSTAYRQGHIPGARFALRSRLAATVDEIPGRGPIVLTSGDGLLARIAAAEIAATTDRPVQVLEGGTAGWRRQGLPVETTNPQFLHDPLDAVSSPWREEDPERRKEGFRNYLAWEVGLVEQLRQDDTVPFKAFA